MKLNLNIKGIVSDVLRVAIGVAAVLTVVINAAPSLHVPAADVAYVAALAGAVNAIIGILKPAATAAVKAVLK